VQIPARREVVFDVIMAPSGGRATQALREKVRVPQRGNALGAGQAALDVDAMVAGGKRV
jgi:hypothetical protein